MYSFYIITLYTNTIRTEKLAGLSPKNAINALRFFFFFSFYSLLNMVKEKASSLERNSLISEKRPDNPSCFFH